LQQHRKRFSHFLPCQSLAKPYTVWKELTFTSVSTLHIPTVFCLSFECGWWERGKAERVLPAFVRARPCKKGPFFFYSPDHREEDHYLYLLSVIAVFCCLASFFYFKIFG
jgi:hypothetical protein